MVDHISRNGCDNRSKNLRNGIGGVNDKNRRLRVDNTSGVNGVTYHQTRRAWMAQIRNNGKPVTSPRYYGPYDKSHPSFLAACEWQKERAAAVGNTNGQQ